MRPSLEGTQASGAGESHAQYANVAEVSYGETVSVEPEIPETIAPPGGCCERVVGMPLTRQRQSDEQVTNGVVGSKSEGKQSMTF